MIITLPCQSIELLFCLLILMIYDTISSLCSLWYLPVILLNTGKDIINEVIWLGEYFVEKYSLVIIILHSLVMISNLNILLIFDHLFFFISNHFSNCRWSYARVLIGYHLMKCNFLVLHLQDFFLFDSGSLPIMIEYFND